MDADAYLAAIVESSADAIVGKTLDGIITSWNPAAERVFGYLAAEVIGQSITILIPRERRAEEDRILAALRRGERVEHFETVRLRKDGTPIVVSVTISPIKDAEGRLIGASKIARDITERKELEARLQSAEQRFRSTIVQIKDHAIFSMDPHGVITTWNEGCRHVLGYAEREFIGMPASRLFPASEQLAEELKTAAAHGIASNDRWMVRKSGEQFWAAGTTNALHVPGGEVVGFTKVMRDITAQRKIHEQLRNTVQRLQVLSDAARNLLEAENPLELLDWIFNALATKFALDVYFHFSADPDRERLHLRAWGGVDEDQANRIRTVDAGETVGGGVAKTLRPSVLDPLPPPPDPMTAFLRGIGIRAYACHPLIAGGRLLGTLSFGSRREGVFTPELLAIIRALADMVSEAIARKEVDDALAASAAQFRLVVEAAPNGMVMIDEHGVITMVNAQMERLFGYARDEMVGRPIEILLPERFRGAHPELRRGFSRSPHTRAMGAGRALYGRRKDGSEFPVEIGLNPAETPHGRVVLAAIIDITERKRTEDTMTRMHEELADYARKLEAAVAERTAHLEQTIAELEGVSYSLSHDMRAPLRTIQGFSQIVLADAADRLADSEKDLLQKTITAAHRLDRLIQDVLTYTRVSRQQAALGPVDVERLLRQVIDERPELQPPGAQIVIEGPLAPVRGHEASLTQCITNLLDNAVKFVAPGRQPSVRIWNVVTDHEVRLFFEDNGIGIPREAQARLFGIFERAHHGKTYPGTGIGLAIVRKAVERMGGTVSVESEAGAGSRFCVQLPRADES